MEQGILSILVSNHSGVLTKVTGLFGRRGYNIKALSVAETENPAFSRITILTDGDLAQLEQIHRQVCKLEEVKEATLLPADKFFGRELMLVKLCPPEDLKDSFLETLAKSTAKITAKSGTCYFVEVTGTHDTLDDLVTQLDPFGIVELSRTGITALELGDNALTPQYQ